MCAHRRRFPGLVSSDLRGGPKRNFQVFGVLDFLAEVTQHIPEKGEHLQQKLPPLRGSSCSPAPFPWDLRPGLSPAVTSRLGRLWVRKSSLRRAWLAAALGVASLIIGLTVVSC